MSSTLAAETIRKYEEYVNPAVAKLFRYMGLSSVEVKGDGCWVTDSEGRRYLDCLGGYGVFSLGHRHPAVIAAVKDQLDYLPMSSQILFDAPKADLAEALARVMPGDLQYSFFVNSGTEAVEGALKLARLHTGRQKVIAAQNAFHGKTFGALSATGRELFRSPFYPLLEGFVHVPYGDAAALEAQMDETVAAVLLEPVQGEGGIIVPPPGYLKAARTLCDRFGALLIADEVQTGLGRTGKWFGVDHEGVVPDIMATAKALGGGVMPIGAFTATTAVWAKLIESPFLHTSTFGGNPLACRAGLAALAVLEAEQLPEKAAKIGAYLMTGLQKIQAQHPHILEEVRGRGMLIGLLLTKEGAGGFLMSRLIDAGILVAYTLNNPRVIRIEPPLVMSEAEADFALQALTQAFNETASVFEDL